MTEHMPTVFYSWSADRPGRVCRHLIRNALEYAISKISADLQESERPTLMHDTKGLPGSPAIFPAIKRRILNCDVFVADLTPVFVADDGNIVPNPNVMMELGIAESHLPEERIVCVMNTTWGGTKPETLPFNIRHRRSPITYNLEENSMISSINREERKLSQMLESAIRESLLTIIKKEDPYKI